MNTQTTIKNFNGLTYKVITCEVVRLSKVVTVEVWPVAKRIVYTILVNGAEFGDDLTLEDVKEGLGYCLPQWHAKRLAAVVAAA